MAKFKLGSIRLHWGQPVGNVEWRITDRDVEYSPPQKPALRDLRVMTGISVRFGPGFAFLGFQYIQDKGFL